MVDNYNNNIAVTGEQHLHYSLHQLAQACINFAKLERRLDHLDVALHKRGSVIFRNKLYGWPSYEVNEIPFLVIHQSQPVCKLPTRTQRRALATGAAKPWCLVSELQPEPGWVKLSLSQGDEEWLYWASKALVAAQRTNRRNLNRAA
jgi:hypothetical protein